MGGCYAAFGRAPASIAPCGRGRLAPPKRVAPRRNPCRHQPEVVVAEAVVIVQVVVPEELVAVPERPIGGHAYAYAISEASGRREPQPRGALTPRRLSLSCPQVTV